MYLRNLFIFLGLLKLTFAQRLSNQERLYQHLFELNTSNFDDEDYYYEEESESQFVDGLYDSRVRPVFIFNNYVNTTFSIKINSLEFFKQPEEKIKFNVVLDLYWKD